MSDSKGAAIDRILTKHARWATDLIDQPVHQYPDATLDPAQAKQAILAMLAQEVNKARIDEYSRFARWEDKQVADGYPLHDKIIKYWEKRVNDLERLG